MARASSSFTAWIVHWLLDPAVTPEKGAVSALEVSSIARRTELSCEADELPAGACVPPAGVSRTSPVRTCCWWVEAVPVWLTANSTNDADAIRHTAIDPSRSNLASGDSTALD